MGETQAWRDKSRAKASVILLNPVWFSHLWQSRLEIEFSRTNFTEEIELCAAAVGKKSAQSDMWLLYKFNAQSRGWLKIIQHNVKNWLPNRISYSVTNVSKHIETAKLTNNKWKDKILFLV